MMTFSTTKYREEGRRARELSRWITRTYRAGNMFRRINRDATPISEAVRDLNHESFIGAAASAIKARRERNATLRCMSTRPGFWDGYREGAT